MIELSFPSKKKAAIYRLPYRTPHSSNGDFSPMEIVQAGLKNISPAEWRRRNAIIAEEANNFFAKVGDTVFPAEKSDYDTYGAFIVIGICHSYKDFGDLSWPKSDNPMIIQIRQIDGKKVVLNATASWVVKKNVHACF